MQYFCYSCEKKFTQRLIVIMILIVSKGLFSGVELYTPAVGQLALQDSISQQGITWKFGEKTPVGQFANGDYYVVGPVTIVSITPMPENGRNGSVLNIPPDPDKSGFDSRVAAGRYDPNLRAELPIRMVPGDVLVSTISVETVGELPAPLRPSDDSISPVQSAAVLTCLEQPVPLDAFRPSYCDREQNIYLASNLRWDLLPQLPRVESTPDLKEWEDRFQRPWLDVCFFSFDAAAEYQPQYGREIGRAVGIASLMLMLDFRQQEKEKLLINFIQYGIDLWGIVQAGYPGWPAHGGHGTGRKWPIVFAGLMLDDEDMQTPNKKYPDLMFGEDKQTMYGNGWTGATALYAGHLGETGNEVQPGWGPYEHLHPSGWVNDVGETYRRCCTSIAWVGQALAARIMRAEQIWNHNAFFDYVDRWMTEDDSGFIAEILNATGLHFSASWARQGQAWDSFVEEMWGAYRNNLPTTITSDEDEQNIIDNFILHQNYPNPFNPETTIRFSIAKPTFVQISIHNLLGQRLRTLVREEKPMGEYYVIWDGRDERGREVSSGIFFYRMQAGGNVMQKTLILLR